MNSRPRRWLTLFFGALFFCQPFVYALIDTQALEQSWPGQHVHDYEVGRYPVRWRQKVSRREGLWAGVGFTAARPRDKVWQLSNDYGDVGRMTPGVKAVRIRQEGEHRKVISVDVKILWKRLTLTFEVEEDPPKRVQFLWRDERFGEYRGVATFEELAGKAGQANAQTRVELATWFKPYRSAPLRLLLGVERIAMLSATKEFLKACDASPK